MLRTHLQSALQNLVLLVPLLLSGHFLDPGLWARVAPGYLLLTALSALHAELLHRLRPNKLLWASLPAYALLIGCGFWLNASFGLIVSLYTALALFNGFLAKQMVVLDVFSIAGAIVIKGVAGILLIEGRASAWGLIFLLLAACTVALGQRRNELRFQNGMARSVLHEYSPKLLDQMLAVVTSSTLVAYALYALAELGQPMGRLPGSTQPSGESVIYSALLVNFGLFRYLYLVYHQDMTQGAELSVARDPQLVISAILWLSLAAFVHYGS